MTAPNANFPRRLAQSLQASSSIDETAIALRTLVEAVNLHDTYTGGHSYRVSDYAANLARMMGATKHDIAFIHEAALVHDIGKIGVPDQVLRKRGPLTDEELHLIRLHPIVGASIVSRMPGMERTVPIVLHHHECWDGSGYPRGLAGIDIPYEARLIFVVDAFDAMTTPRPYADVKSIEEALGELRQGSGSQFDPLVVDAMHDAYRNGLLDRAGSLTARNGAWSVRV